MTANPANWQNVHCISSFAMATNPHPLGVHMGAAVWKVVQLSTAKKEIADRLHRLSQSLRDQRNLEEIQRLQAA